MVIAVKNANGYCKELSGDCSVLPEWVIKRLNFLEEMLEFRENIMCPLGTEKCPDTADYPNGGISCYAVKHCFPYLCECGCGKCNTMYLVEDEIKMIREFRRERHGISPDIRHTGRTDW